MKEARLDSAQHETVRVRSEEDAGGGAGPGAWTEVGGRDSAGHGPLSRATRVCAVSTAVGTDTPPSTMTVWWLLGHGHPAPPTDTGLGTDHAAGPATSHPVSAMHGRVP